MLTACVRVAVLVLGCVCGAAQAGGGPCYPAGGVAGIVVATIIVTLVATGLAAAVAWRFWWTPRQNKNEGKEGTLDLKGSGVKQLQSNFS